MLRKMYLKYKYPYAVTRDELLQGGNATAHEELEGKPSEPVIGRGIEQGLENLKKDVGRDLWLNGKEYSAGSITKENITSWFGSHADNFLLHYSQDCAQTASKIILGAIAHLPDREISLSRSASRRVDSSARLPKREKNRKTPSFPSKVDFRYDKKKDVVYCEVISSVQLSLIPGSHQLQKKEGYVELFSRFKLLAPAEKPDQAIRYDLIEIRTASVDFCNILQSNPATVLTDERNSLRGSFVRLGEDNFPKENSSLFWKIVKVAAVITALIGISLLVASFLYLIPPVALTLPYLGVLLSGSPLAFAGAGFLGATGAGLLLHRAATSEWFMEKWRQVPVGWKVAAGVAIGTGIAAVIIGAVFFPPLLAFALGGASILAPAVAIYGGLGLAVVTGLGHLLHILLKKPPESARPPALSIPENFMEASPVSSARNSLSERDMLPSPPRQTVRPSSRRPEITPDGQPPEKPANFPANDRGKEGLKKFGTFASPTAVKNLSGELGSASPVSAPANEDDSVKPALQPPPDGERSRSPSPPRSPRLSRSSSDSQ